MNGESKVTSNTFSFPRTFTAVIAKKLLSIPPEKAIITFVL